MTASPLTKVKMYSSLVSTIPAALFVSFLGPISDQVSVVTASEMNDQLLIGGKEDSDDNSLSWPHFHLRSTDAQCLCQGLASGGNYLRGKLDCVQVT